MSNATELVLLRSKLREKVTEWKMREGEEYDECADEIEQLL